MAEPVIQTSNLAVYYGARRGIEDVNLTVERGEVFGFLGPNGAGKTTMLRVLMDIIRPTSGQATIFGLDCHREGVAVRRRVGYLPGELNLDPRLKASDFLDLLTALHRDRVDDAFRRELCRRLDLNTTRKMGEYSKGNKQKVGIVAALMSKPELVVLDEPTGGLDPLVQQSVMDIVEETRKEGRTVFFSSHVLPEVQAVCDRVGIIRAGRLIEVEQVAKLTRQKFKRIELSLAQLPPPNAFALSGVKETKREGLKVTLEVQGDLQAVMKKASEFGIVDVETPAVTLEEVFLRFYDRDSESDDV